MSKVEAAKAALAEAEAEAAYLEAKSAFQADPEKRAAFDKAKAALVDARNEYRLNYRTAPNGAGDGTANPDPVNVSLEVK